ncbi:MAG: hypothetical protein SOW31_08565 [Treponema sp.]|nr:hypothetical protein [Treponema sp.]
MGKSYTKKELLTIKEMILTNGHLTYQSTSALEEDYFKKTGVHRVSGALYMAAWRLERGYYDNILSA